MRIILAGLLATFLAFSLELRAGRPIPPACLEGRFLPHEAAAPLVVGGGGTMPEAVTIDGATAPPTVAIISGCAATTGILAVTHSGTRVRARWPRCGRARRVRLTARLDAACQTMTGTVSAAGTKPRRFVAARAAADGTPAGGS